ncbi:uncharacterized protein [Antedon mediterranea]|uniref:uncharacterized protein isoform X2 n=1 Tax=Antedon mediterranea TaxID=105859 RepID=UPI003AF76C1D
METSSIHTLLTPSCEDTTANTSYKIIGLTADEPITPPKRKSRRFDPGLDIALLQLVFDNWPIINVKIWEAIAMKLGPVTPRGCKDRFRKLLAAFKANDIGSLRGAGTIEEYKERERLLVEVGRLEIDQAREGFVLPDKVAPRPNVKEKSVIKEPQKDSNSDKQDDNTEQCVLTTAAEKRNRVLVEYVEYLKIKAEREFALNIEKTAIERERFELERKEREAMIAHDANIMKLLLQTL